MFSKRPPQPQYQSAQCPVCNAILGQRESAAIYKAHCKECRATYFWKPWQDKPSAVLDSQKPERKYCGPNGCVCRD